MSLPKWLALRLLAALLLCGFCVASAQTLGSISGFVRDGTGSALPGISLSLSAGSSGASTLHATTDKLGEFYFDHLALSTYQLTADSTDEAIVSPNGPLTLSTESSVLHLDLKLAKANESAAKPPALQLQAAGIRGYIDPGGYSAPAGAAAAAKLIQGAADLNRAKDNEHGAAVACGREPLLLKAALDHPHDAAAQRQLGRYYLAVHQPEKALTSLKRARSLNEGDPTTLLLVAEALVQDKQFAAAHDLMTADTAGADKAAVHRLLARSYEGLGAFQQASVEYQAAATMEGTEADFYGAGYELILAGSAGAGVKVFEQGIARYPKSTTLLTGVGTADFLLGDTSEATRIFLRNVNLHPDDSRLYAFLSASSAISGSDPDDIEASFRRYYEMFPKSADAAYFYAMSLSRAIGTAREPGEAETLLKQAVELDPGFAKAHLQLGSIYFDRKDYTHAANEFATALRLDPGLHEIHYRLSLAYRRSGQTSLADEQMNLFRSSKSQNTSQDQQSGAQIEQFLSGFVNPGYKTEPNICANSSK